ncbi:NAD(P)-binding protein [Mycena kentingensis (nom. inval.)]|nr:NAD(P)-binding protein [Mycena kentingensis (nom. inval.)]
MAAPAIQKKFLSASTFAVVGASKDTNKFGTKILNWYKERGMPVHPVHPRLQRESELEGIPTVASIADLPAPAETSISIVTPPKVTLSILESALALSVPALWIQPGAADDEVVAWIKENGMADRVVWGGPCILVLGDRLRASL